jgi:hypothetical protein
MPAKTRNSKHWMSDFEKVCECFYEKHLNKKSVNFVKENFDAINDYCDNRVEFLKNEMKVSLLDRHKVTAVYVCAFLKHPVFVKHCVSDGDTVIDYLANEYVVYVILQMIVNSWCNGAGKLLIPQDYGSDVLKLFSKVKKSSMLQVNDTTIEYVLANVVYLLELSFLS